MSDDISLFGDDAPPTPVEPLRAPTPIADWQVDLLRKALDARGLATMAGRQQAIESAAGRPVASLRALSHEEAIQVLSRVGLKPAPAQSTASQWDDREGETWIDRL